VSELLKKTFMKIKICQEVLPDWKFPPKTKGWKFIIGFFRYINIIFDRWKLFFQDPGLMVRLLTTEETWSYSM
ncbi:MAG: hypothetical protein JXB88_13700, partial [Spirochaetales bacterium]|nr:hypothetical protein [Spirochaetales bacterium]